MRGPAPLTSPLLAGQAGVRHGFFTREGGVSRGIYEGLNAGPGSRDEPADVAENRRRAAAAFGLGAEALHTCHQVHSARVATAGRDFASGRTEADGVVAGEGAVICAVLTADCAPVLIADAAARVVAAVHAGWRGALGGVVAAAVDAMVGLGARRERMVAAVGPCIGPDSYEVGPEFLDRFVEQAPASARFFQAADTPGKHRFDLPGFVLMRLAEAGVRQAAWTGHDTYADGERFFSNRRAVHRAEGDYGRLLSAIVLA